MRVFSRVPVRFSLARRQLAISFPRLANFLLEFPHIGLVKIANDLLDSLPRTKYDLAA